MILQKGVWILSDDIYPSISSTTTRVDVALMAHSCNFVGVGATTNVSLDIKELKALSTRHGPYTPTTITHNFGISVHTELLHLLTPYPCRPLSPAKDRPMIVITRGLDCASRASLSSRLANVLFYKL